MAQKLRFSLQKQCDNEPWGIRVNGGADFAFPLTIVKIKIDSSAFKAGLQAGDVIIEVNGESISDMESKDAHKKIIDSGNCLKVIVRRFPSE